MAVLVAGVASLSTSPRTENSVNILKKLLLRKFCSLKSYATQKSHNSQTCERGGTLQMDENLEKVCIWVKNCWYHEELKLIISNNQFQFLLKLSCPLYEFNLKGLQYRFQ